jgi:hypothetical protein
MEFTGLEGFYIQELPLKYSKFEQKKTLKFLSNEFSRVLQVVCRNCLYNFRMISRKKTVKLINFKAVN